MQAIPTALEGVLILEPRVHRDERGFFIESWNRKTFREVTGRDVEFVQDNQSHSLRGVLRGLHYQRAPHAQCKLVRVLQGAVYDVAVDMRRRSPTFGKWIGIELSAENRRQLWMPEGFAHGFYVLSATADVAYKVNTHYAPGAEECVQWNDPDLAVAWPLAPGLPVQLSSKDRAGKTLREAAPFE